ncbi:hypothetical protein THF5H11_30118 [Vibrio jasicida]|nr:hypothetical protein THF5H11_30118 [Vibrio jasicida]
MSTFTFRNTVIEYLIAQKGQFRDLSRKPKQGKKELIFDKETKE